MIDSRAIVGLIHPEKAKTIRKSENTVVVHRENFALNPVPCTDKIKIKFLPCVTL